MTQTSQLQSLTERGGSMRISSMNNIAPSIQFRSINFAPDNTWTLYFYEEFASVLEAVQRDLEWAVTGNFSNFARQMSLGGVPFLVAFFFDKREIRLYSTRLFRESLLSQKVVETGMPKEFAEHVDAILKLSPESFPTEYDLSTHRYSLVDLVGGACSEMDAEVEVLSGKLLKRMDAYRPSLFERFSGFVLHLTARYDLLRIHLLKFVAVLPSLEHDKLGVEVKRILLEHLRRLLEDNRRLKVLPRFLGWMFHLAFWGARVCPLRILRWKVRFFIHLSARLFIAGEDINSAEKSLKALERTGRGATLDPLGELVFSEEEADAYRDQVLEFIRESARQLGKGNRNLAGINSAHVSIKVSALCSDFRAEAFEGVCARTLPRLREILLAAKEHEVFINIDAEHYDYRDLVFKIYRRVLLTTPELADFADTGIVVQSYLRDGAGHLAEVCQLAQERKITMPIRLVKGAYWDVETIDADAHSWNAPEFLNKEESDLLYRQLIVKVFESWPHLQLCLAGHNFADHCFAEILREKSYSQVPPVEHQCLHMTCEALSQGMVQMGWVVRNYIPIGPLLVGMAYLVRRIMENSSQMGVLTLMHNRGERNNLSSPVKTYHKKQRGGQWVRDVSQKYSSGFANVTPLRCYVESEWGAFERALKEIRLGVEYGSVWKLNGEIQTVCSPNDSKVVVGQIRFAAREDVSRIVNIVDEAYSRGDWAKSSIAYRSGLLLNTAALLLAERNRLAALIVHEAGKTPMEALGDVDEAIDFLNYYACCALDMSPALSRGSYGVISPWNFPLAIPCGMVAAPLVSGNTVVLKSAEQTPLVASRLIELFHQAGVPKDVLIHLPGMGESVGAALVEHPRLAGIVFTGSREVGTQIIKFAGRRLYQNHLYGDTYPVKVIAEMGGKNAIIVTDNAELDETVAGILESAFGHAGQKCSAASRVIVHNSVKTRLIARLRMAINDLTVAPSSHFDCLINPLITRNDQERLRRQVREATLEAQEYGGKVWVDRSREEVSGWCVGPSLIELSADRSIHPDSYARKELFGPVLHLIGVDSLDESLKVYNATEYALTGGIFSQSQDDIDYLSAQMESGNIYINRNITGARVAVEPFGGFKFSGTGPKAGHKSYLRAFCRNGMETIVEGDVTTHPSGDIWPRLPRHSLRRTSMYASVVSRCRTQISSRLVAVTRSMTRMRYGGTEQLQEKREQAKSREGFELCLSCEHPGNFDTLLESMEDRLPLSYREQFRQRCELLRQDNRKIPGQVSYNDWNLKGLSVLLVSASPGHISHAGILQVVAAAGMGASISLACLNPNIYQKWSEVVQQFHNSGWHPNSINAFLTSESVVREHFKNADLSVIILEGLEEFVQSMLQHIYSGTVENGIKTVLTSVDVPVDPEELDSLLEKFTHLRSFAVNTVRYGAPFELNLD